MEEDIKSSEPEVEQEVLPTEEFITEEIPAEELEESQQGQEEPEILE